MLQAKIDQTEEFAVQLEDSSEDKSGKTSQTHTERSLMTSVESSR